MSGRDRGFVAARVFINDAREIAAFGAAITHRDCEIREEGTGDGNETLAENARA